MQSMAQAYAKCERMTPEGFADEVIVLADACLAHEAATWNDDLKIVGNAAEWHYNEGIIKGHAQAIEQFKK